MIARSLFNRGEGITGWEPEEPEEASPTRPPCMP